MGSQRDTLVLVVKQAWTREALDRFVLLWSGLAAACTFGQLAVEGIRLLSSCLHELQFPEASDIDTSIILVKSDQIHDAVGGLPSMRETGAYSPSRTCVLQQVYMRVRSNSRKHSMILYYHGCVICTDPWPYAADYGAP